MKRVYYVQNNGNIVAAIARHLNLYVSM